MDSREMCVSPEIVERSREEKGTGPGWWASGPGKSPVVWRKCEQVLDWGEGRHGHGDGARSKVPPGAAPNSSAAQVSLGAPHDQQCSLPQPQGCHVNLTASGITCVRHV